MGFTDSRTGLAVPYNDTVTRLSEEQRAQAAQGARLTQQIQLLYSIALYDVVRDEILPAAGLDPGGRTAAAEYFFSVPPKVHEFDEPFATSIVNTQDGGKFVESYGSIIKSIRISGTTGVRPNKVPQELATVRAEVTSLFATRSATGALDFETRRSVIEKTGPAATNRIPANEITGHDDIVFLRNIFRHYSDLKASDQLSGRVVMLWRNIKDADYWIVEPEDFRLSQNSASPLKYDYNIALKTLGKFDFSYSIPVDEITKRRGPTLTAARTEETTRELLNSALILNRNTVRLGSRGTSVRDRVSRILYRVTSALRAARSVSFGIIRGLRATTLLLQNNTLQSLSLLIPILPPQDIVINTLRRILRLCDKILTLPPALETTVGDVAVAIGRYTAAYQTPGTLTTPRSGPTGSPTYIGSESPPAAVESDVVYPGEDIRDVAARVLDDRDRWRILVALNKLRAPFISPTGGPGILAPGDPILYPSDRSTVVGGLVGTQKPTSNETKNNSSANTPGQLSYGRDLVIQSTFVGAEELTDLVINQRGDLGSIAGLNNVQQAIRIKFITQRGELPAHQLFGAKFPIGRKATSDSFTSLRLDTLRTILSDTRVRTVENLSFQAIGDTLAVAANVVLENSQDVLSTSFALRRF